MKNIRSKVLFSLTGAAVLASLPSCKEKKAGAEEAKKMCIRDSTDIILFVFIDAFDGIYRKRVPVSRRMDNGCNIGGVFQIHNIDSSAIGRYPEFVIYL